MEEREIPVLLSGLLTGQEVECTTSDGARVTALKSRVGLFLLRRRLQRLLTSVSKN